MKFSKDLFKKKWPWLSLAGTLLVIIVIRNNWSLIETDAEDLSGKAEIESTFSLESSKRVEKPDEIEEDVEYSESKQAIEDLKRRVQKPQTRAEVYTKKPTKPLKDKDLGINPKLPALPKPPKKPEFPYFYLTNTLHSTLKDEPMLDIILQLEFRYSKKALKDEIQFKEKELETLIQTRISEKDRGELTAPILRMDLKKAINGYLKAGEVQDIIFKDFKIEIRK